MKKEVDHYCLFDGLRCFIGQYAAFNIQTGKHACELNKMLIDIAANHPTFGRELVCLGMSENQKIKAILDGMG